LTDNTECLKLAAGTSTKQKELGL